MSLLPKSERGWIDLINEKDSVIERLADESDGLSYQLIAEKNSIKTLEHEIEKMKTEIEHLRVRDIHLREALCQSSLRVFKLEGEIEQLIAEVDKWKASYQVRVKGEERLSRALGDAGEESERLKGEYDAISKHFDILKISCGGKDAEIERLQQHLEHSYAKQTYKEWERNRKLITKLADALRRAVNILSDQGHCGQTLDELSEPLQQAREATKDE